MNSQSGMYPWGENSCLGSITMFPLLSRFTGNLIYHIPDKFQSKISIFINHMVDIENTCADQQTSGSID